MTVKRNTERLSQNMKQLEDKQEKIEEALKRYHTVEEQIILEYEASIGRTESVIHELSEEEKTLYSNACQEYLNFGKQVDACLEHELPKRDAVKVCNTPLVLQNIGLKSLSMHISQRHLTHCMREKNSKNPHQHGLTKKEVKKIPEALEHPVMVAESFTKESAIVVILGYRDSDNLPIIVSIEPQGEALYRLQTEDSNFITSVYGKNHFQNFVDRIVEQNKLLYIDNEKSSELALLPLQLRQGHPAPACNHIIRKIGSDVNGKKQKEEVRSDVLKSDVPNFGTYKKQTEIKL